MRMQLIGGKYLVAAAIGSVALLFSLALVLAAVPIEVHEPRYVIKNGWTGEAAAGDAAMAIVDTSYDALILIQKFISKTPVISPGEGI